MTRVLLGLVLMAWSYIGGGNSGSTTNKTITYSPTLGNLVLVGYMGSAAGSSLSIADTGTNSWGLVETYSDGLNNNSLGWWYAAAKATGAITVTITDPSGSGENVWIAEYNSTLGVAATPLDGHTVNGASSGSAATNGNTSGQITPTGNGRLIVGWIADTAALVGTGTTHWTAGTTDLAYTKRAAGYDPPSAGSWTVTGVEDAVQATAGAVGANWTAGNTDVYVCFVAAFAETSGPPPVGTLIRRIATGGHRARPFAPGVAR